MCKVKTTVKMQNKDAQAIVVALLLLGVVVASASRVWEHFADVLCVDNSAFFKDQRVEMVLS